MPKPTITIATFLLLTLGSPANAAMVAGELVCTADTSRIKWNSAAPADLMSGSMCGGSVSCPSSAEFFALAEELGCVGTAAGQFSPFVCSGSRIRVLTAITELCEEVSQ